MQIIIEVDGDMHNVSEYLSCIVIDRELIKSIKFER